MRQWFVATKAFTLALACWAAEGFASEPSGEVILVKDHAAVATVVVPDSAQPIAKYAAEELVHHIEKASGARLAIVEESAVPLNAKTCLYLGSTRAAAAAGIDVTGLPSEAVVVRTINGQLFIAALDGPGDPLSFDNTTDGSLWGVYEVLERELGVRWLWPGDLGVYVPRAGDVKVNAHDETVKARFVVRGLRPGIDPRGPGRADARLAFSEPERERYAHDQAVFLRRHRIGRSSGTIFSEPAFQSGHCFAGWWKRFGKEHPEWFQLLPDGRRGPRPA